MISSWVVIIDVKVDKVLILKRSRIVKNPGQWCFPGGSAKNKNPIKLAKTEAFEEVGIEYKKKDLTSIIELTIGKSKNYHYYIAFAKEGFKIRLDKESKAFKWVKLKSLERHKNQHGSIKSFVKKINEEKYNMIKNKITNTV